MIGLKKNLVFLMMFFTFIGFGFGENEPTNYKEDLANQEVEQENISNKIWLGFFLSVESDLVDYGKIKDCFTVNVRVYMTTISTGQKLLLASENVMVGNGCPEKQTNLQNSEETKCMEGYLPNGDYVLSTELGNSFEECLIDLLANDDELYHQYIVSTRNLISDL